MIEEHDKQFIQKAVEDIVSELSLELVDLLMKKTRSTVIIDVLADRINGGITVEECSQINKRINAMIEESELFNGDFIVEVSSPGLDRPLKTSKDFMRVKGKRVIFYLNDFIERKKEHSGEIINVDEADIRVKLKDQEIKIPLTLINKAVQII